jgi:hypothetical protein
MRERLGESFFTHLLIFHQESHHLSLFYSRTQKNIPEPKVFRDEDPTQVRVEEAFSTSS